GSAPSDLESYWSGIVADCYTGDINLIRFEELNVADYNESKVATHKLYLVEIDVGGGEFATGYLSVPVDGEKIRLKATFVSYGNTKKPKPAFTSDAAVFTICAHSYHLDDPNAAAPDGYGFDLTENQNRDTVYFKNMFIRNIMATRFLKAYIGDNSYGNITLNGETLAPLGRWAKGDNFTVDGGSQAGFQALAITALDKDVTKASIALTWFCDIGGENLGRFDGWNPEYTDALMYYDCCTLATLIGEGVEVSISAAGLGDTTSEPTGIIALYNALNCTVSLKMYQNRSHTYNPPVADFYTVSK
ncbi:MAG: acetylxylan esterase, partial [Clostridia bacterium]|nr:acetylxylan esterase [Clostridia bacterium]